MALIPQRGAARRTIGVTMFVVVLLVFVVLALFVALPAQHGDAPANPSATATLTVLRRFPGMDPSTEAARGTRAPSDGATHGTR